MPTSNDYVGWSSGPWSRGKWSTSVYQTTPDTNVATTALGTPSLAIGATTTMTGIEAILSLGSLTITAISNITLTLSLDGMTAALGTVSYQIAALTSVTGIGATLSLGSPVVRSWIIAADGTAETWAEVNLTPEEVWVAVPPGAAYTWVEG